MVILQGPENARIYFESCIKRSLKQVETNEKVERRTYKVATWRNPMLNGISPIKLLYDKSLASLSNVYNLTASTMFHYWRTWLSDTYKTWKEVQLPIFSGIEPLKLLFLTSLANRKYTLVTKCSRCIVLELRRAFSDWAVNTKYELTNTTSRLADTYLERVNLVGCYPSAP